MPANVSTDSASMMRNPQDAFFALSWCGRSVLLLFVIGWIAWFFPFDDLVDKSGTPMGGDYVMLYVSGQTLLSGESAALYDDRANQARTAAQFPSMESNQSWPFRYPPVTAWLMTGPAQFSFGVSYAIFAALSLTAIAGALLLLVRAAALSKSAATFAFWSLAGWPLVGEAILGGQTSPIALLLVVGGLLALRGGRDVLAGVLLGLCIYKPNIVGILIIGTIAARPKTFWGMLLVAIPAVLISIHAAGFSSLIRYAELATSLATTAWQLETPFWKVHGIAPYLDLLTPGRGKLLAFVFGIPVAVAIGRTLRNSDGNRWWLSVACLLTANSLFNPYVPIYDLLLLAPAGFATTLYFARKYGGRLPSVLPVMIVAVAAGYAGPHLSQAFAPKVGLQLFPLCLLGLFAIQVQELFQIGGTLGIRGTAMALGEPAP